MDTFLVLAWLFGIAPPGLGYIAVLPALVISGLLVGALGTVLSSAARQLEKFAGTMNFIIFPIFFLSSALYPLWKIRAGSVLVYWICEINPFTHAVELIRFTMYLRLEPTAPAYASIVSAALLALAVFACDPTRGMVSRTTVGALVGARRRR